MPNRQDRTRAAVLQLVGSTKLLTTRAGIAALAISSFAIPVGAIPPTEDPPGDPSETVIHEEAQGRLSTLVTNRGSQIVDMPELTELSAVDGTTLGAHRMLLAIDALAELGAFEPAQQPQAAAVLSDIRTSINADNLTEAGYIEEIERFADDFIPYLEFRVGNGAAVSDDLWWAADGLEIVILGPGGIRSGSTSLLSPDPWIVAVGDLLFRDGAAAPGGRPSGDAEALRTILAQLRLDVNPIADPATLGAQPGTSTPLAGDNVNPPAADQSPSFPVPFVAAIGVAVLTAVAALIGRRRRSRARSLATAERKAKVARARTAKRASPGRASAASDPATKQEEPRSGAPSVADLLDASRRMTSSLDTAAIADIALHEAQRLADAEGGIIVRRTAIGLDPVSCEPPMLFNYDHLGDSCLPRVIDTGRSSTSIATDEPLLGDVPMALAAVPIVADGVVSGAILVVRVSARPFTRDELDSLEMLAPLVASAFAAADTHETATELNDVEPLTGLQNRRRLDLDLASISPDDQVAYVMVDIDHFKNFNDTNGHAAGDEALRHVSALLKASVRPNDLVYRYGGEEFCMLLPGTTAAGAAIVAERARNAVENANIPGMESQPDGRVTISVGVSDSAWGAPNELVEQADAALYESKRNGRNRVSLHQP